MRSVLVALLVTSAAFLAGCSDDGGHDDVYTCPDGRELNLDSFPEHHNSTFNPLTKCGGGSSSNTTSQAPNVLPVLKLTVKDDGGNTTNVGVLNGNLTFSAEGSTDSDGKITGIAVSVTDSNTTRTASLYDATAKAFKPATFKFDRPGVVNVTVAMVDDRAGFTTNQTKVYVNHPQVKDGGQVQVPGGASLPGANHSCRGAADDIPNVGVGPGVFDSQYFKVVSFTVFPGATKIAAVATESDARLTICSPLVDGAGGEPLSPEYAEAMVETNPGVALPAPPGTASYYVGVYAGGTAQGMSTEMTITVHYEPQTAAPAAE